MSLQGAIEHSHLLKEVDGEPDVDPSVVFDSEDKESFEVENWLNSI